MSTLLTFFIANGGQPYLTQENFTVFSLDLQG
jgi:hypothetical protein